MRKLSIGLNALLTGINVVLLALTVYILTIIDSPIDFALSFSLCLIYVANIIFIKISFHNSYTLLKIYITFFIINYAFRLTVLLYDPQMHFFIGWILTDFNYEDFRQSVLVLTAYHIATGLFLIIVESTRSISNINLTIFNSKATKVFDARLFNILFRWFVILSFYWLAYNLIFQLGRSQDIGLLSYVNLFLGFDFVFAMIFLYGLMYYNELDKKTKINFFISLFLFSCVSLSGGSRGFLAILLVIVAIYLLIMFRDFRIKLTFFNFAIAATALIILLTTVVVGDIYRTLYRNPEKEFSIGAALEYSKENPIKWDALFNWASFRTSRFEYFSMIVVMDDKRSSNSINPINAIKVVINDLVPGEIFTDGEEKIIPSHMAIPIDYLGAKPDEISPWHTDVFGLFGTSIANMGIYTGLPFTLMVLLFYISIIGQIYHAVPLRYKQIGCIYVCYLWYGCLTMPGLESFILSHIYLLMQVGVFILFKESCQVFGCRTQAVTKNLSVNNV